MISDFTHTEKGIEFVARAIRRDKEQLRADISIKLMGRELDRDEFRFGDRPRRNAMAGGAFSALKEKLMVENAEGQNVPADKELFQFLLRRFLDRVAEQWASSIVVEDVAGLTEPAPPPWIIRNYVTEGAITLLASAPGMGKSWTGMLMAQSVQCGDVIDPIVFDTGEPQPVLYVNLERSKLSLQNRLGMVNRVLGIPPQTPMPQVNARGRSMSEVSEAVRRHLEANDTKLIVIDSLSRMGMGSMTSDDTANDMMDMINSFACGAVVLAHTPRPQGPGQSAKRQAEHVFGSQMITAAADFEIILKAKDMPGQQTLVGMKVIKANDAPKARFEGGPGWRYDYGPAGLTAVTRVPTVYEENFEED